MKTAAEVIERHRHLDTKAIIAALESNGFSIVRAGTKCPFGKGLPDPGLGPCDPCPICGDLGTFDQERPSKCIG